MKMKRILVGIMAVLMSVSLAACSGTEPEETAKSGTESGTQTQENSTQNGNGGVSEEKETQAVEESATDETAGNSDELALFHYACNLKQTNLDWGELTYETDAGYESEAYNTKGLAGLEYDCSGCLFYTLRDMDGDNATELLTINLEKNGQEYEMNTYIYEAKDGQAILAAKKTLLAGFLREMADSASIRVMLKDEKYICLDSWQHTFVSADGVWIDLYACYYNGAEFVETAAFDFCGSDWYGIGKSETELVDQLNTMGYKKAAAAVYDRDVLHFCAADEGVEALLKISLINSQETGETQWDEKPFAKIRQYNKTDLNQGYILPQSNTRLLTADELKGISKKNLRLARNEIYARYGWRFEDEALQEYFSGCAWYTPAENVDDAILSDIERANKDLIVEAENNRTEAPVPMRDYMGYIDGIEELDAKELGMLSGFLSQMDAYGFVQSMYEDVRDVNLGAIFYSGAGIEEKGLAEKTADEYLRMSGQEEIYTDYIALKEEDINQLLTDKTGYGLADMHYALGWQYLPESKAYGSEAGDTNYAEPQVVDGVKTPDGTYYVEYHNPWYDSYDEESNCILTLKETDHGYQFVSNRVMR